MCPGYARRPLQSPQCVDQTMEAINIPYTHLHRLSQGQQAIRLMPAPSFEPGDSPDYTLAPWRSSRHLSPQRKGNVHDDRSSG